MTLSPEERKRLSEQDLDEILPWGQSGHWGDKKEKVKIISYASEICWWMGCIGQICPVIDVYKPTGYIKIGIIQTERGFEDQPFEVVGWIDPNHVQWAT